MRRGALRGSGIRRCSRAAPRSTCVAGWPTRRRSPSCWLMCSTWMAAVACWISGGPGSLTLLLASHFEVAVGVDADEQMPAEAERQAVAAGITNIEWVHGEGEDISPDMGLFRAASMAASFRVASTGRFRCRIRDRLDNGSML